MADNPKVLDTLSPEQKKKEVRKVVASSYLGSTIEFYDFMLYASAASLVFGPVFFANLDPLAANVASLATFATGYLARPLGGVIFGHFGDRVGRKKVLVISMMMMGIASFCIGLIPSSATIGSWAAILLVTLRLIQGIAVGGEWGGAALMSLEHANKKSRGFAASFTNAGAPTGVFLGTSAMGLAALLPEDQFFAWGWRIPFLASFVLLAIGMFIRAQVTESPIFKASMEMAAQKKEESLPVVEVLRHPKAVVITALGCAALFGMQATLSTFAISYAVESGAARSEALFAQSITGLVSIVVILIAGKLSDQFGRRRLMYGGILVFAVLVYPLFGMLGSGQVLLVFLAFTIGKLCYSVTYGPMAAYVSEQFGPRTRYTGASLAYQGASLLGAAFTPVILAGIYATTGGNIIPVAAFLAAMCVMSAVCVYFTRESKDYDLTVDVPAHGHSNSVLRDTNPDNDVAPAGGRSV